MATINVVGVEAIVGCIIIYYITLGIYRLYFHPLAKFPGPRLAALTLWYEFYYDVIGKGRFLWKIKELHEQYGPIVRITPFELHINDPDYYDQIYTGNSRKTDKYKRWLHITPTGSIFATVDHDLHRKRRAAFGHFFSKQSIQALEPILQEKVTKLVDRFRRLATTHEVVDLTAAYAALTMDVVAQYSFGESLENLDQDDFGVKWLNILHAGVKIHPVARQFPWLFRTLRRLPKSIAVKLNPSSRTVDEFFKMAREQVKKVLAEQDGDDLKGTQRTMFHEVKAMKGLPDSEKTEARLTEEAFIFVGAGTETTAKTLAVISFHLIQNPEILKTLREELKTALPKPDSVVSYTKLEKLPFLSAIISEGLRISLAVSSRLPRISRDVVLRYGEWSIPAGTPVGQSSYLIHTNEEIFPDPFEFQPQRWLENEKLDRYLVPFSKGTRMCIGMNLAYAELFLAIAAVFRRFDMELFETSRRDVDVVHEYFLGVPALDSKGIKARVTEERED